MITICVYGKTLMILREKTMDEIKLITKDKVKIAVNYYKNGFDKVVILAPGWFMTKDSKSFKEMSEVFSKYSDVVAMDFRGHGRSGGFYTFTRCEILDILTVMDYFHKIYNNIYLVGFSLGASIVIEAATKRNYVKKVIAISAPAEFDKIENKMWKKEAWIPTLKKCELKRWFSVRPSVINGKKVNAVDIIQKVKAPTLFLAGEKDPTVYNWHTKELYEKAVCDKRFELFEHCNHAEDLFIQDREKFVNICCGWLFEK